MAREVNTNPRRIARPSFHACIIVNGGAIQGTGINVLRNIPGNVQDVAALGIHAEVNALRSCSKTEGGVAYVARVNKHGEERMSRPCPNCIVALRDAGIKRVIYTIDGSLYL